MTHVKRGLVIVFALIICSGLLFASGSQDKSQTTKGVVNIRVITSTGGVPKALDPQIEKFNAAHAGSINVTLEAEQKDSLLNKLMSQFITKTAGYDVMAIDGQWGDRMNAYLEPMAPYLKKDNMDPDKMFGGARMKLLSGPKGVYALPLTFGGFVLFYRTDIFQQNGIDVPTTLDDYLDKARKLTKKKADGSVEMFGSGGLRCMGGFDATGTLSYFMIPMGVRVVDKEKKDVEPSLNGPVAVRTLQLMDTLNRENLVPNPNAWDQNQDRPAFAQGKLAMSVIYSSIAAKVEDPNESVAAGKTGYVVMTFPDEKNKGPRETNVYSNGWSLCIDQNSPKAKKDAAWEFIKYVTTEDVQLDMALNAAHPPTRLGVLTNPEYLNNVPSAKALHDIVTDIGFDILTAVPQGTQLERAYHDIMQSLFAMKATPKQTADALYDATHEIMTSK
jgi:ABC-type glycerol-3-phosphate transport system substrate-binding protein